LPSSFRLTRPGVYAKPGRDVHSPPTCGSMAILLSTRHKHTSLRSTYCPSDQRGVVFRSWRRPDGAGPRSHTAHGAMSLRRFRAYRRPPGFDSLTRLLSRSRADVPKRFSHRAGEWKTSGGRCFFGSVPKKRQAIFIVFQLLDIGSRTGRTSTRLARSTISDTQRIRIKPGQKP